MHASEARARSWSADLAERGELPARYLDSYHQRLKEMALAGISPGGAVLDIGSGRDPLLTRSERPGGATYVGLDISVDELEAAPGGSYDETVVVDLSHHVPDLDGRFDVVVSWQVLEHVERLPDAIANVHRYVRPGGRFLAVLSGRYAAFSVANRVLPDRLSSRVASRVLGLPAHDIFPAHYDRCHDSALRPMFAEWADVSITPVFRGAVYFRPFPPLLRMYLVYESWAERSGRRNLATHYLISATS